MDALGLLRLIFGSLFLLAPGLAWGYLFYQRRQVGWIERLVIALGLSLVLIPLAVFWLNLTLGVKVTLLNVMLIVSGLTVVPLAYLALRARFSREKPLE